MLYTTMRRTKHTSEIFRSPISYTIKQEAQESSDWLNAVFKETYVFWVQKF